MKINDANLNAVTSGASQAAAQAAAAGTSRAGTTGKHGHGRDAVELSGLSSALRSLAAGGPEHSARIEKLAAAYQSGNYRVDSPAVSRHIVNDALRSGRTAS